MKQKLLWMRQILIMLIIVAVAVVGSLSLSGQAQQPGFRTTWEYKVISTYGPSENSPPPNVPELDRAGSEGWELINIHVGSFSKSLTPVSNHVRTDYYFKRAK